MSILTAVFEGMFIRGGRKDNFLLFLVGQALLIVGTVLVSTELINTLLENYPFLYSDWGPFFLLGNRYIMTAFALLIWVHEIGHYAQNRRFGAPTFGIIAPPIGGVQVPGYILSPAKLIEVALGGPMTGIAALSMWAYALLVNPPHAGLLLLLAFVWVGINLLNLLPFYPMDGGLIVVELLSYKLPRKLAIQITTGLGIGATLLLLYFVQSVAIVVVQVAMVIFMIFIDSKATKMFYWFSQDYLKIEQPTIVRLTRKDVVYYTSVYVIVFVILALITWVTWIYNPFPIL